MPGKQIGRCPVCGGALDVIRLNCPVCDTSVEGRFETCKFCQLPNEQRDFVEVFIKCRGNIKEVERELGISYPTVRNKLDAVIGALGYPVESREDEEAAALRRRKVLEALDRGEISAEEAARALRQK